MISGAVFLCVCACVWNTLATTVPSTSTKISSAKTGSTPNKTVISTAIVSKASTTTVAATTTAASATTLVTYTCLNGSCDGNATCINSTTTTCTVKDATHGCYRKQLNATSFQFGCRNCILSSNKAQDWCCQGKTSCVFDVMPGGGTVTSLSAIAIMGAIIAAFLLN